ncbi:MAG: hypothetical protein IE880_07150 [Epsilonproteobacteria bacterium]|nr:hypothetical protein [Campylobacterota bacterium]
MKDIKNTFIEKLHECKQHKMRLLSAKKHLETYMPIDRDNYLLLNDVDMGFVDQMIFRFSKLQDTMGDKLFPSLLELMSEDVKSKPFIDRLNRIEELGIVYKDEWLHLRKNRNEIAHEYSFNQDEVIASVNVIFDSLEKLIFIFDTFYNYCKERFEFVKNSEVLA